MNIMTLKYAKKDDETNFDFPQTKRPTCSISDSLAPAGKI